MREKVSSLHHIPDIINVRIFRRFALNSNGRVHMKTEPTRFLGKMMSAAAAALLSGAWTQNQTSLQFCENSLCLWRLNLFSSVHPGPLPSIVDSLSQTSAPLSLLCFCLWPILVHLSFSQRPVGSISERDKPRPNVGGCLERNQKTGARWRHQRTARMMARSERGEMVRGASRCKLDLVISLVERAQSSPMEWVEGGGWRQQTAQRAPLPSAAPRNQESLWAGGCQHRCRWVIIGEKQLGRGQRGGHEGRQIEEERELGRGYHPRRSLSQPLIVACVHWSKSTIC